MAFSSGSATSQVDLITQLFTFAAAAGWTIDENPTGGTPSKAALHRGDCYVQFGMDRNDNIGVYQSLGFTPGNNPKTHPDDSNVGPIFDTNMTDQRRIDEIGNGPFTQHLFFAPNSGGADADSYIYVALQYAPGIWRHFGFGHIDKVGSWVGGEFAYGHVQDGQALPTQTGISFMLDGIRSSTSVSTNSESATVHVEALPGVDPAQKWGICGNWSSGTVDDLPLDGNGEDMQPLRGGGRQSPHLRAFGPIAANPNNAAVPLIPIPLFWFDPTQSPERYRLLGYMRDVRYIQMGQFDPGQEIVVGGDTWVILPWVRKTDVGQEESENAGVAYRKIT